MKYAKVNIVAATAHLGSHESLFSAEREEPPVFDRTGRLTEAHLARHSLENWLPVLSCACREDVRSGQFFVAGPSCKPSAPGSPSSTPAAPEPGDPEALDFNALGSGIDNDAVQMVWELCHHAVVNFLPHPR
jgi:hypothetical protein